MIKILVTGGSGFIGTNLVEYYHDKAIIKNIDINEPRNKNHIPLWENIDILDFDKLRESITEFQPHIVFHMAARTDLDGKNLSDYDANIKGVKNIIDIVNEIESVQKIIFASSRLVCKIGYTPKDEYDYMPTTFYGESKMIGEKIVREYEGFCKQWIIVRPTSIWGPWFDIPYKNFFTAIQHNRYFHPQDKKIKKLFGYVKNSVFILDRLSRSDALNYKTLYLSDFEPLDVKEWADQISQRFHHKNVREIPYFVLKILALAGDIMKFLGYKNPPLTSFRLDNLTTEMLYDIEPVQQEIGKLPYSLEDGVRETVEWMMRHE